MPRSLLVRNLGLYKDTDYNRSGTRGITVIASPHSPNRPGNLLVNILSYSILTKSLVAPMAPEYGMWSIGMYVCVWTKKNGLDASQLLSKAA